MEFTVRVDGGTILGEDMLGPGTPVVLLHPGWGDSTIWDPVIARISGAARTIRYDMRGYGRSPAPTGPFTAVADAIAVLEQLDVTDAILVGHSGGGATAVGVALAQPRRVQFLILAAPGISDYPWPESDPYFAEFDALFSRGDREGLVALGLSTWAAASADEHAEAQIRAAVRGMYAQDGHLQDDPPAVSRLHRIRVPTEILIGDRDHPMVVDCAKAVAAGIAGSRMTMLPGVDHMLPLREPQLIANLIATALD